MTEKNDTVLSHLHDILMPEESLCYRIESKRLYSVAERDIRKEKLKNCINHIFDKLEKNEYEAKLAVLLLIGLLVGAGGFYLTSDPNRLAKISHHYDMHSIQTQTSDQNADAGAAL